MSQENEWKERALRYEKEAAKWMEEATRAKAELEHWRNEFETLLEASLQQINRAESGETMKTARSTGSLSNSSSGLFDDEKRGFLKNKKKNFINHSLKNIFADGGKKEKKEKKEKHKTEKVNGYKKDRVSLLSEDFVEEPTDFIPPLAPSTAYQHLPRLQVCPVVNKSRNIVASGPENDMLDQTYGAVACGKCVSTYPHLPGNPLRDGDPICDRFAFQVFENRIIACVADGCNWGERPRVAARKASSAFLEYLNQNQDIISDVKKAGAVLLNSFEYAHNAIVEGKMQWEVGTTTLLGGVLLEINKGADPWTPQWEFVCASVGDCKAYCFTGGEVTDITQGNRLNASDACDCGGRLGPHLDEGKPDLRNLNLFCASCEEGDLIIIVTDGIHDNLDPQHLGKLPEDMPKEFNLHGEKWDEVDPAKAISAKNVFTKRVLENLLEGCTEPKQVTEQLIKHCLGVTEKSRDYMEKNQGKRLPEDYVQFPGKMDHTTCLCFRVGRVQSIPVNPSYMVPTVVAPSSPGSSPGSSPSSSLGSSTSSPGLNHSQVMSFPSTPPTPSSSGSSSSGSGASTSSPTLVHRDLTSTSQNSRDFWTKSSPSVKH